MHTAQHPIKSAVSHHQTEAREAQGHQPLVNAGCVHNIHICSFFAHGHQLHAVSSCVAQSQQAQGSIIQAKVLRLVLPVP